jgi:hypothetical protein
MASNGSAEAPAPTVVKTYPRTVAWWPYTVGPTYGVVDVRRERQSDVIYTAVGSFVAGSSLPIPSELTWRDDASRLSTYLLVQFRESALASDFRATLASMGASIVAELPVNAAVVRVGRSTAGLVQSSPMFQHVEPYHPAFKLDPAIGALPQISPEAAASPLFSLSARLFDGENVDGIAQLIAKAGGQINGIDRPADPTSPAWVHFIAHASLLPRIAAVDGIFSISENGPMLRRSRASLFLQSETGAIGDFAYWKVNLDGEGEIIEVTDSGMSVDAGDLSDTRGSSGWNSGATSCNVDTTNHRKVRCYRPANDFGGAGDLVACDSSSAGGASHGSNVTAVALGNATRGKVPAPAQPNPSDDGGPAYGTGFYKDLNLDGVFDEFNDQAFDGIAKDAKVVFIDAESGCPESVTISAGNLNNTIVGTWNSYDANIHNFSFGSEAPSTGPVYAGGAADIDNAIFTSPINFLAISAGNSGLGTGAGESGTPGNIGNQSSCKNCVVVGGSLGIQGMSNLSSHGPAQNTSGQASRRIAPTLTAEFIESNLCRGEEGAGNPENQTGAATCEATSNSGTSFSSPNIAGAAAVIRDYFASGFYPDGTDQNTTNASDVVDTISSALVKAIMIVGTKPNAGLSYRVNNFWGYGQLFLTRALAISNQPQTVSGLVVCDTPGNIDKNAGNDGVCSLSGMGSIGTTVGTTQTGEFQVLATDEDLGVALVWHDPSSSANLVNDLDLEVRYCGSDQTCGNTDDRVFQGNNFSEDYDRDGTTFDDIDNDASIDGYFYSISTKQITDDGNVLANWRDNANNTEAVFIPVFLSAPDRNGDGTTDVEALSNNAAGTLSPKTGKWQVSVIRRAGTTNDLKYAIAISGPVTAGSSARFDTNPVTCNGDVRVNVAEVANASDPGCPDATTCSTATISARTVVDVLDPADVVIDSQAGLTFTQKFNGATPLFSYESNVLPLSATQPAGDPGILTVGHGYRLRVRYTDQPGAEVRVAFADVDCQPDFLLLKGFTLQLGLDSFVELSSGCDLDDYLDAGEAFSLFIDYANIDSVSLLDANVSLRALTVGTGTAPCFASGTAHPNLSVVSGPHVIGEVPGQTVMSSNFNLKVVGTPAPRTRANLVFALSGGKSGQQVESCFSFEALMQADDDQHLYITDCPTGCTLNFDRNNDERLENRIASNPFDVYDVVRRGLDETSVAYENLQTNNTSGWPSPCSSCGNPGFAGVWDFDTNDEGFRSGVSPQSALTDTLVPITNWGEDRNWDGTLQSSTEQVAGGTSGLDQNWATTGGCGFMSANGTSRGIWHTGTIGTWVAADDTTVCRPNDSKCEEYDRSAGTTGANYWFNTLRTPVLSPTRFGTDPDGFKWRTQILDWAWNQQLDFPDESANGAGAAIHADFDLDTVDNNVILGDDLIQAGGMFFGNQLGLVGGGQNNIYGGAFAFADTNQKHESNYGDGRITTRGGNRSPSAGTITGRRGCYFNDLNLIADGTRTAAYRPHNLPKPDDDDCDNDWTLGANGCPGNCGVDDDGNGVVDDFGEICPCKRCNGGPRNLAFCQTVSDCNPDGSLTNPCQDATGATKGTAFTSPDGVPVAEGDDVCGDGSIDEFVSGAFGTSTTIRQERNMRIDGDANGVGGVGTPVGDIRFNTLEDFYGELVGPDWQGEVGMVTFEGSGGQSKQSYGIGIDDMVVEWMEVHPIAQAGTACSSSPAYNGHCATLSLANTRNTLDGDLLLPVTVVDPVIGTADNLVDCNSDGTANEVRIEAWSEVESVPELFCLVQTGAGTGTFNGLIRTTTRINKAADGSVFLAVNGADTPSISARYIDKQDGVRGVNNGPDNQPGIAGFDDDGDGTVDDADELCPGVTNLAAGRTPHLPGQKARWSDDNCGCIDNPIVDVAAATFDVADVIVADVLVRDTAVSGVGNGDNDGWADPGEVVNLDLVLKNYSNFPIEDVAVTISTGSANVACITDNEVRIARIPERSANGTPGVFDTATGTDHFAFRAQGSRTSTTQDFSSTWTVALQGLAKGGPAFAIPVDVPIFGTLVVQSFKVVHNLNATGTPVAADFFDNFEGYTTDASLNNSWPRFNTGNDSAELEGTRCQTNDPANPFGNNTGPGTYCEVGEGFNNNENHWHLHASDAGACDGGCTSGAPSGGPRSRNAPGTGGSGCAPNCRKSLSSANVLEGPAPPAGDKLTMDVNRMTWVEMQNSVLLGTGSPELSYWTQMSLQDNRLAGLPNDFGITVGMAYLCVDKNSNNDCDTAETGLKNNSENWEVLRSYFNPENAFRRNFFINCSYDPSDDGNNENQFFPNQLDVGPSSTCFPVSSNNCLGRTADDRTFAGVLLAADVTPACYPETDRVDDPNISVTGFGGGRWTEKRYSLDPWRGQRVLVRFHIAPFGWPGIERWSQFAGINNEDDGWFLDDVRITGAVTGVTLNVDNTDKGGAACPATNCDTVTAKAAILENPRNDSRTNLPKRAVACTSLTVADCDYNNDNLVDHGDSTAESRASGHGFFLDGSASVANRCLGGALEYLWTGGELTGTSFTTDPFAVVAPIADTTYTLTVRCSSAPTCSGTVAPAVDVPGGSCSVVVNSLSFTSSTSLSWTGSGTFDVARGNCSEFQSTPTWSTASCLADNLAATTLSDATTPTAGQSFYYVLRCADGSGTYNDGTQQGTRSITACP